MPTRKPTPCQQRRCAARANAKQPTDTASPLPVPVAYTRQDALAACALGLLVVVCYLPAMLWGEFVWDDNQYIKSDPVEEVSGLWQIWFSPGTTGTEDHYLPLLYTTFWLEHKLWGFEAAGYHIVNVLLHMANTLLVWHVLRRLAAPSAWLVAAVFAVHPLHVESVAWIIERKDVLSGLFYLAALAAWVRFVEQPRLRRYVGALALYAAALLSKSIAITLPATLLVGHWLKQGRIARADLVRLAPFFTIGAAYTVGDLSFSRSVNPVSFDYSWAERALIAAPALWFYVGKLVWPSELVVIYPHWDIRPENLLAWGYLMAAVVLVAALWHYRHQIGRGPLAGALFFGITLSPVLGFVDHGYMKYSFVADRFQYLAGIGIIAVVCGAAALGVGRLSDLWQKGAQVIAAAVVIALGISTWQQQRVWRDGETLWRYVIEHNPKALTAHLNLGYILYTQGQYEEALEVTRVAVDRLPHYYKAHMNLGAILKALGRFEEAETHLRRAIALNPQAQWSYSQLCRVLYSQGRHEEALEAARTAIEQHPDYSDTYVDLGWALNDLGRPKEAEAHLRRAIAINPQTPDAYSYLGIALHNQGRYEEAVQCYDRALALDPTSETTRANRGAALKVMRGK